MFERRRLLANAMLRVAFVAPYYHPATIYGGPALSMLTVARALVGQGCEVRVLTTNANGSDDVLAVSTAEQELEPGIRVRYCPRRFKQATSLDLLRALPEYVRWCDVVHIGSVYNFPTIPTLVVARILAKPVVLSPQGALQRWAGSTSEGLKDAYERVCRVVAPRRFALHVTSRAEQEESLARLPGAIAVLIPHGIPVPTELPLRRPGADVLRLAYLGRLHPKKGIENLLEACALLGRTGIRWSLTVAGDGDPSFREALERRVGRLDLGQQVTFVGHLGPEGKAELFARSDLLVVPSFTENFGLVIAEALARAVPVIASRGTPWEDLEQQGAGLWVDNDPETLSVAIRRAATLPLEEMGAKGRAWMQREFTTERQGAALVELYERLLARDGGAR